ncbi:uncharacterized protein LY79DRAFT_94780 [Colletotrichum navitas]|uniref:Secreted protein n=1 Tax=Colletotrichum navitas TaxID=681940 RepID=A0AAD8Q5Y0_9PEZI|nr:uncharacterized protein LY79DRAFT_94780 [Colletotrichum navitas]KAK1595856.1 hypothetical protein LY79DRAFT_94780 [Colletotrichum navitas]
MRSHRPSAGLFYLVSFGSGLVLSRDIQVGEVPESRSSGLPVSQHVPHQEPIATARTNAIDGLAQHPKLHKEVIRLSRFGSPLLLRMWSFSHCNPNSSVFLSTTIRGR